MIRFTSYAIIRDVFSFECLKLSVLLLYHNIGQLSRFTFRGSFFGTVALAEEDSSPVIYYRGGENDFYTAENDIDLSP